MEVKYATLIFALPQDAALILRGRYDFSKSHSYAHTENRQAPSILFSREVSLEENHEGTGARKADLSLSINETYVERYETYGKKE